MEISAIRPATFTLTNNYRTELEDLIAKLLTQISDIAKQDREQKRTYEARYLAASKEAGYAGIEMGNRGLTFAIVSLGLLASQFLTPVGLAHYGHPMSDTLHKSFSELSSFLSNHGCNQLASMFNSQTQAHQREFDSISQLAMSEINAMMNKSSDASKQELLRILESMHEALRSAARG